MKIAQAIILVAVLVGAVFGLSYLTQYSRKPIESKATNVTETRLVPLRIPVKVAVWDEGSTESELDRYENGEFEKGAKGHYDFWVSNPHQAMVAVQLLNQSCTCFDVKLGIVPATAVASARVTATAQQAFLAATMGLVGAPELAALGFVPDLGKTVQWHQLVHDRDHPPTIVQVPPADPMAGPQLAIIRFSWEVVTTKPIRLQAEIQHQFNKNLATTLFEVPLSIVGPILAAPGLIQLGDINNNEHRESMFFIWSATRPNMNVNIENMSKDPCVEIGPLVQLNDRELRELPRALLAAKVIPQMTRMRCGFKVVVTVHEKRGENQLELGPIGRRLTIRLSDGSSQDTVDAILMGNVRGAIRVGEPNDKDRIDLGVFRANRGTEKNVNITSTDPEIKLSVASAVPSTIRAELKEQSAAIGQKRWLLHIEVDPDSFSGLLPPDTAIFLQTEGNSPRRIRIPLSGVATH